MSTDRAHICPAHGWCVRDPLRSAERGAQADLQRADAAHACRVGRHVQRSERESSLEFQTVGTVPFGNNHCELVLADLATASGIELLGRSNDMTAALAVRNVGSFFHAVANVRVDGCASVLGFTCIPGETLEPS